MCLGRFNSRRSAENCFGYVVTFMHPSTEKALALLDRLEGFEVTERGPAAVDALENWDALRERSMPTTQRHDQDAPLIYKRFELQPVQPQKAAVMDE